MSICFDFRSFKHSRHFITFDPCDRTFRFRHMVEGVRFVDVSGRHSKLLRDVVFEWVDVHHPAEDIVEKHSTRGSARRGGVDRAAKAEFSRLLACKRCSRFRLADVTVRMPLPVCQRNAFVQVLHRAAHRRRKHHSREFITRLRTPVQKGHRFVWIQMLPIRAKVLVVYEVFERADGNVGPLGAIAIRNGAIERPVLGKRCAQIADEPLDVGITIGTYAHPRRAQSRVSERVDAHS